MPIWRGFCATRSLILPTIARMFVQEHRYRLITGRVLCLGPQQVALHRDDVNVLFAKNPEKARQAAARWRANGAGSAPVFCVDTPGSQNRSSVNF